MRFPESIKKIRLILLLVTICIITVVVTVIYTHEIKRNLYEEKIERTVQDGEALIKLSDSFWNGSFILSSNAADYIKQSGVNDNDLIKEYLKGIESTSKFEYIFAIDANNNIISDKKVPEELKNLIDQESLKKGKNTVSKVYVKDEFNDSSISMSNQLVIFSTPIIKEGILKYSINVVVSREYIYQYIVDNIAETRGITYLVNDKGDIIFDASRGGLNNTNLYDIFDLKIEEKRTQKNSESLDKIIEDFNEKFEKALISNKSTTIELDDYQRKYIMAIVAFDEKNNIYLVTVTDDESIVESTNRIIQYSAILGIMFFILITGFFIIMQFREKDIRQKEFDLAYKDNLTGIWNQNYIQKEIDNLINSKGKYAYISLDINNFKFINNLLGFDNGNLVLKIIGEEINSNLKEHEIVARYSVDIYSIIFKYETKEEIIKRIAAIIVKIKKRMFEEFNRNTNIEFSCGVCLIEDEDMTLRNIADSADIARKKVKGKFGVNIEFFDNNMRNEITDRNNIEEMMEKALLLNEFKVYLQPKINMISSKLVGAEALVRWESKEKGFLTPDKFIPIFENNGFIIKLDFYVFEQVCEYLALISEDISELPTISVNMSRLHLYDKDFVYDLKSIADRYQVDTRYLEIEITENAFFEDAEQLIDTARQIKKFGFKISVDDFGSGYSSLNMLKDIAVDIIKIDKQFLDFTDNNEKGKKILKSIIGMANDINMEVVIEGVETREQVNMLTTFNCEIAQGYYYSRPLPINDYNIFSDANRISSENKYEFSLDDNLYSSDNSHELVYIGEKICYTDGVLSNSKALHLESGEIGDNMLKIPVEMLNSTSYTISLWIKPEDFHPYTSVIFVDFENGFMSYMPNAWRGAMSFRIKEHKDPEGWYDASFTSILKKDRWYHIAVSYNSKINEARLYVDGKCVSQLDNIPVMVQASQFFIGGDIYQPSFKGAISNLMISDHVKSPKEIENLYDRIYTE